MEQIFLRTKLFVPPARSALVRRNRLIGRLAQPEMPPLILVSAPAGAGKTTLLREWIDAEHPAVAWLSLDEGDNDPARFWTYVIAAIQTGWNDFGESVLDALRSPQPIPIESLLVPLINEIAAAGDRLVLILDDYHVIAAPAIHEAMTFLLDHLPPQLRIIISSRSDPVFPLGRMRARNQILELRAADLRFTPDEATTFLNQIMGLGLSANDIAALEARIEGWIAGLQLAALSLQQQGAADRAQFIAVFTGNDRYVLDYLVTEILNQQPDDIQDFLLATSILDRLSESLCDALTRTANGQAVLETLEHANMFLIPLDNQRHWYRYHHLFADLLRHELQRRYPGRTAELHQRAAVWHEQQGYSNAAMEHMLAAHDYNGASRLLRLYSSSMLLVYGEPHTLMRWLEAVPEAIFNTYPAFRLARSWSFLGTAQPELIEQQLRAIEARADYRDSANQPLWGEMALLRATVGVLRGDLNGIFEYARQAADWVPDHDTIGRSFAAWLLGQSYRFSGKAVDAERAFLQAAELSQAAGSHFVAVMAYGNHADRLIEQGKLHAGFEAHRALQSREMNRGRYPLFIVGDVLIWSAIVLREWNDLEGAARDVKLGLEITQDILKEAVVLGHLVLSRIRLAQGDKNKASEEADKALASARGYGVPYLRMRAEVWQAQIWVAQELFAPAIEWVQKSGLQADDPITYRDEELYLGLARIWIAVGRGTCDKPMLHQTEIILERVRQAADAGGRAGRVLEVMVLQALLLDAENKEPHSLSILAQAVALGKPEGYTRVFLDEGAPIANLLRRLIAKGMGTPYAEHLLSAYVPGLRSVSFALEPTNTIGSFDNTGLQEPLSEREREVLRLVTTNLSNQEIAERLCISVNTVKTHIKRIYEKMGVTNRVEATELARQMRIM